MKSLLLNNSSKALLSTRDIAKLLSISSESAKVTASRYVSKGLLIRVKKDCYIPLNKYEKLNEKDFFGIANVIQVPSYVSLTSALSYYNLTTQQLRNVVESVALKRTKKTEIRNVEFIYSIVKKDFYSGFELVDNIFIATPEKAIADAVYLSSLGRYNCDFDAINFNRIIKKKIDAYIKLTNLRTKLFWGILCKRYNL
jgi:predicted transcriptional regulator of viral defense system